MKFIPTILLFFFSIFCYSQNSKKKVILKIESFKDSVMAEPDANVKLRLINTSDSPISILNSHPNIYCKLIRLDGESVDTINTETFLKNVNWCMATPDFSKSVLNPGESKVIKFSLNLYGYGSLGFGRIKLKIFYELKELNKGIADAESNWFIQYLPKIY